MSSTVTLDGQVALLAKESSTVKLVTFSPISLQLKDAVLLPAIKKSRKVPVQRSVELLLRLSAKSVAIPAASR